MLLIATYDSDLYLPNKENKKQNATLRVANNLSKNFTFL